MFFNTFVNPIALDAIEWRYYIVFIAVLVVFGVTAYFWYPETKGYSLEEIAVIFDGPGAVPRVGGGVEGGKAGREGKGKGEEVVHAEDV